MITKQDLIEYDLTHEHAGNGFAMVEDIDSEWCRVAFVATPITQVFLAWKKKLRVTTISKSKDTPPEPWTLVFSSRLYERFMGELADIRRGIKSGELIVKNTRIIKPEKADVDLGAGLVAGLREAK
jgi:hypothetical protein